MIELGIKWFRLHSSVTQNCMQMSDLSQNKKRFIYEADGQNYLRNPFGILIALPQNKYVLYVLIVFWKSYIHKRRKKWKDIFHIWNCTSHFVRSMLARGEEGRKVSNVIWEEVHSMVDTSRRFRRERRWKDLMKGT